MPMIFRLLNDEKHCQSSEYMIQFKLCGEDGCDLCSLIGRKVRTPATVDMALHHHALSFVNLPVPNPMDKEHYLPPKETTAHIINNKISHSDLESFLPSLAKSDGESKKKKEDKTEDAKFRNMFKVTKARRTLTCGNCTAPRVAYSMYAVGSTAGDGPKKRDIDELGRYIETGSNIYGYAIPNSKFHARTQV